MKYNLDLTDNDIRNTDFYQSLEGTKQVVKPPEINVKNHTMKKVPVNKMYNKTNPMSKFEQPALFASTVEMFHK
jgi:hypothetical protein